MDMYSTKEVAEAVGIHWVTLHRWKAAGKVHATQRVPLSGMVLSRWTGADIERVRKYKASHYCKGRGRKKRQNS
jgi:predicted site-specific integrase-resolvase